MDINFFKIHVLKNDFILCDLGKNENRGFLSGNSGLMSEAAVRLCDRRTGAGGCGIIYLFPQEKNDYRRVITYSPDGTLYESLLDSCMISSRYIFDTASLKDKIIRLKNNDHDFLVQILDSMDFRILAGSPYFDNSVSGNLVIDNYSYNYTNVKLVKNGMVFFPSNKTTDELKELTRKLLKSSSFSGHVPIFSFTTARNSISIKSWGQGHNPDNTLVSCIASVASSLNGYDNDMLVMFHKNYSYVEWDRVSNEVFVSSRPEYIYTGNFYFDENNRHG